MRLNSRHASTAPYISSEHVVLEAAGDLQKDVSIDHPAHAKWWPCRPPPVAGVAAGKSALRWPAGAAPATLQAAEVDAAGSFLDALLHDFLEDGEEVEGHIADVPVAPDDVVEDEVGLCLVVGGLLAFDLRLQLGDAPF
jgi:hypothetical protein